MKFSIGRGKHSRSNDAAAATPNAAANPHLHGYVRWYLDQAHRLPTQMSTDGDLVIVASRPLSIYWNHYVTADLIDRGTQRVSSNREILLKKGRTKPKSAASDPDLDEANTDDSDDGIETGDEDSASDEESNSNQKDVPWSDWVHRLPR